MSRGAAGEALARVRAEIEKEKAEALGRAGARLEVALRALRLIRDEVEALEAGRATPADALGPRDAEPNTTPYARPPSGITTT